MKMNFKKYINPSINRIKTNKFSQLFDQSFKNTHKSLCRGSTSIRLLEVSIGECLNLIAKKFPYSDALISCHQKVKISYEELNYKVDLVSKSLLALNLPRGSKVGVYAPNSEEWVLCQFACARIGLILVNINPTYQINDLKFVLNKVGINLLIMPRQLKSSNYLDIINKILPELKEKNQNKYNLNFADLPNLKNIILLEDSVCGDIINADGKLLNVPSSERKFYEKLCEENNLISWKEFYDKSNTNHEQEHEFLSRKSLVKIDDPVNIQFTSGTTGLPKGAVLSHYNILNNGYLVGKTLNYTETDKVLIQVPLYHCFGSVMGNLACMAYGATMVYPNGSFDSIKSLTAIENEKINSIYGVPTMFLEVLNNQLKFKKNISTLKKGIMAGAICPKYLMERCINELGLTDLTICYGMTELSPVTHQVSTYDSFEKKTTTVGLILPHTVSKIVNEDGETADRNITGEICTKSYGLMLGYYEDEKATRDSIDNDGFMKTGDLGYIDDHGYLYIEGRKKDVIIRGGENISPKEIEDFLGTHPMVDDVQIVAAKDDKFGDEICAWIKLKEGCKTKVGKEDIRTFCRNQIAHYKIPKYVKFVETFPMTITGKPQKFKMREITNKIIQDKSEEM